MVPLTRILSLTAACALVVLTAATPARAGEFAQKQASVGTHKPECHAMRHAQTSDLTPRLSCSPREARLINTAAEQMTVLPR